MLTYYFIKNQKRCYTKALILKEVFYSMAKIKINKAIIIEERAKETTIEECFYLILSELTEKINCEIHFK